ncbi:MAG: hypothetical protein JSW55_07865 [Chloroflexota bacterium]|nr:MAG: hypothetical protein JSW55_07865 [Chloroflexota bacterium]
MKQVEIRIKGRIDQSRSGWFDGFTVTPGESTDTVLSGEVVDQAALFGLLTKIRDLGLVLISVQVTELTSESSAVYVCKEVLK